MAKYKAEHGFEIKHVSSDPPSPITGQIWYNTTTQILKVAPLISAWSAGGPLNTSRSQVAGAGIQTAGLAWGGTVPTSTAPSETNGAKTEEYNGTSWTNVNDKSNKKRQQSGLGIQTAALDYGGYADPAGYQDSSEEYDGTSWTAGGDYLVNYSNGVGSGCGTLTAAFNYGGYTPDTNLNSSAEYNGTSWTAGNNSPYAADNVSQTGTQTAALGWGGNNPPAVTTAVEYDGTNFSVVNSTPVATIQTGSSGTQTAAHIFGGFMGTAHGATTHEYDGTNWSTSVSVGTGRHAPANTGTSSVTDGFFAGGDVSETTTYTATEEFSRAVTVRTADTT